jgi:hypothetical protein
MKGSMGAREKSSLLLPLHKYYITAAEIDSGFAAQQPLLEHTVQPALPASITKEIMAPLVLLS